MSTMLRSTLLLSLVILVAGLPPHPAVSQEGPLPMLNAEIVSVEGAARTYQVVDRGGKMVEFTVPSKSASDIRFSRTTMDAKMVDVTVRSIDRVDNQVAVTSDVGQTVVLRMDPADVAGLEVSDRFTLVIPYTTVP